MDGAWIDNNTCQCMPMQQTQYICKNEESCISCSWSHIRSEQMLSEDDEAPNKYVIEASDLLALAWSEGIKATAKL
jgi:hypothetical protein